MARLVHTFYVVDGHLPIVTKFRSAFTLLAKGVCLRVVNFSIYYLHCGKSASTLPIPLRIELGITHSCESRRLCTCMITSPCRLGTHVVVVAVPLINPHLIRRVGCIMIMSASATGQRRCVPFFTSSLAWSTWPLLSARFLSSLITLGYSRTSSRNTNSRFSPSLVLSTPPILATLEYTATQYQAGYLRGVGVGGADHSLCES